MVFGILGAIVIAAGIMKTAKRRRHQARVNRETEALMQPDEEPSTAEGAERLNAREQRRHIAESAPVSGVQDDPLRSPEWSPRIPQQLLDEMAAMKAEVEELRSTCERQEEKIDTIVAENKKMKNRMNSMSASNTRIQQEMNAMDFEALQDQVDSLQGWLHTESSRMIQFKESTIQFTRDVMEEMRNHHIALNNHETALHDHVQLLRYQAQQLRYQEQQSHYQAQLLRHGQERLVVLENLAAQVGLFNYRPE